MIDSNVVFDSVRRGYTNLSDASNEEIPSERAFLEGLTFKTLDEEQ